ncbi:MAG TPA: efflux RND transporter periplasmic adaptor subunit [Allosphingosinicella sp.]|nr:efflux RND transporter periplasmic adaptor subunit [Allosphingosinicella sp.]
MSEDDLPPPDPDRFPPATATSVSDPTLERTIVHDEPRRLSGRGRAISWIAGLLGLLLLIAFAIYLTRASSPSQGQGARAGGRGGGGRGGRGRGGGFAQPTTVGTAKAALADLPVQIEALGTVTPAATVTVRPQVAGTITQLLYREGQLVRRGQPLAIIDPRPFRATLLQAQGAMARDQAQLRNARLLLGRYNELLKLDSVARQDRDTQAALVGQLEGTVTADRGAVQMAQINLGYTRIVAPVAGRIGLKVVDVGNYIGAGDSNGIAVVTTLQPIDIEFAIPQQQVGQIEQGLDHGNSIPVLALDSTRTQTLDHGLFSTLDNRVDPTTGTVKGKARFQNASFQLYPSEFVNVRLTVSTIHNAVSVPPAAIRSGPDGNFVWLLKPDRTVTERKITTGVATPTLTQVTSGLAVGDTVITDGGDRLTEGARVMLPGDQPPVGTGRGGRGGRHGNRQGGQGNGGQGNSAQGNGGQGNWQGRAGQGRNGQSAGQGQNGQNGGQGQGGRHWGGHRRGQGQNGQGNGQSGGGSGGGQGGQTG